MRQYTSFQDADALRQSAALVLYESCQRFLARKGMRNPDILQEMLCLALERGIERSQSVRILYLHAVDRLYPRWTLMTGQRVRPDLALQNVAVDTRAGNWQPVSGAEPEDPNVSNRLQGLLLACLPPAQIHLICRYYLDGDTLETIAQEVGVSASRLSQSLTEAVQKLRHRARALQRKERYGSHRSRLPAV